MQTSENVPVEEAVEPNREEVDRSENSVSRLAERIALRFAIPAGILIGVLVILANLDRNPIPMLGDNRAFATLTFYTLIAVTVVVGTVAYVQGARAWNRQVPDWRLRPVFWPAVPIGLAYAVLVAFLSALILILVEFAFKELALARLQAAVIVGAVSAAFTQWVVRQSFQMTVSKLVALTSAVIAIGVYLTAATIDDPLWWQVSFSYLGTVQSSSNTIFNVALAFTGLLILIWLPFFISDLQILVRHGLAIERSVLIYRIAFIWLGIGVAFVGIFKSGFTPFSSLMHNWSAYSLAGVFAVMMLGLWWLVPGLSAEVFTMSWILMGGLVAALVMAAFGYFNTVGLEIFIFALGLTWLSSFIGSVSSLAFQTEPEAFAQ